MDDIKRMKEKQINDFIYTIDMNNASVSEIKKGLKSILQEEPAIKFNYDRDSLINEETGKAEWKEHQLESIEVTFTYIGDDNFPKFGTIKYLAT